MNLTKIPAWMALVLIMGAGCAERTGEKGLPPHRTNADPKKTHLEYIDSLILSGGHRRALVLIDSFQKKETDMTYLILSEVLLEQALDSFYNE